MKVIKAEKKFTIIEINDIKFALLNNDKGISEELMNKGIHEPYATELMTNKILKPGMVILDIGANIGWFAFHEAKTIGETGRIYAIEPIEDNVSAVKRGIKENKFKNMEVFHLGLAEEDGEKEIAVMKFSNSASMFNMEEASDHYKLHAGSWKIGSTTVKTQTLDSFIAEQGIIVEDIDMLRMDVEGYEVEIIMGATETLKNMKSGSCIFLEIHPIVFADVDAKFIPAMKTLLDNGFMPKYVETEDTEFPKGYDFLESDILRGSMHCPRVFFVKE